MSMSLYHSNPEDGSMIECAIPVRQNYRIKDAVNLCGYMPER